MGPEKTRKTYISASEIGMIGIVEALSCQGQLQVDRFFCIFLCNSGDSFWIKAYQASIAGFEINTLQRRASHITYPAAQEYRSYIQRNMSLSTAFSGIFQKKTSPRPLLFVKKTRACIIRRAMHTAHCMYIFESFPKGIKPLAFRSEISTPQETYLVDG